LQDLDPFSDRFESQLHHDGHAPDADFVDDEYAQDAENSLAEYVAEYGQDADYSPPDNELHDNGTEHCTPPHPFPAPAVPEPKQEQQPQSRASYQTFSDMTDGAGDDFKSRLAHLRAARSRPSCTIGQLASYIDHHIGDGDVR
jgi:hypothetical protein